MRSHTHLRSLTCTHVCFEQAYMYTDAHAHCSIKCTNTKNTNTLIYAHTPTNLRA